MPFNPDIHHRRSIRLKDYDYSSAGAYFVTLCVLNRECIFGEVTDGVIMLNHPGEIVQAEWLKSAEIRKEIELDAFIVMPNHLHGIIVIDHALPSVGATGGSPYGRSPQINHIRQRAPGRSPRQPGPSPRSLGALVAGFKSATTIRINEIRQNSGCPLWQRNYYERVIRDERELERLRDYITGNPAKWAEDRENPVLHL